MSQMLRNWYVKLYTVISHYIQNVPLEFGFGNRLTRASLQPVDAVRGKVDVKSRQSLGSVYQYSTQTLSADLARNCPQCATAGYIFYKN